MVRITKAQHQALRWLRDRGGTAALDPYGHAVAQGAKGKASPATWLRLMINGDVAPSGRPGAFLITEQGLEAARVARP